MYYSGTLNIQSATHLGIGRCLKCNVPCNHRTGLCQSHRKVSCAKCAATYTINGEQFCAKCRYRKRKTLAGLGE